MPADLTQNGSANTTTDWCEDEAVLHDIYSFSHRSCSDSQSAGHISRINSIFSKFSNDGSLKVSSDLPILAAAAEILSSDQVHWFPQYGCAVLALAGICDLNDVDTRYDDEISILVVGLDCWKFQTHR
jgi:hypothetical protein